MADRAVVAAAVIGFLFGVAFTLALIVGVLFGGAP
jgi:hypothetical protein